MSHRFQSRKKCPPPDLWTMVSQLIDWILGWLIGQVGDKNAKRGSEGGFQCPPLQVNTIWILRCKKMQKTGLPDVLLLLILEKFGKNVLFLLIFQYFVLFVLIFRFEQTFQGPNTVYIIFFSGCNLENFGTHFE